MEAHEQSRPQVGMNVIDSDNHLVGTVEAVEHDHFVVGEGLFFLERQRIPCSAIAGIYEGEIRLRISRERALHSSVDTHWDEYPEHGEIVDEMGDA